MQVIRDGLQVKCKCLGVSGSCAVKTCWRQMTTFQQSGTRLKKKYNRAKMVDLSANQVTRESHLVVVRPRDHIEEDSNSNSRAVRKSQLTNSLSHVLGSSNSRHSTSASHTGRNSKNRQEVGRKIGKRTLAYLEKSPNFCESNKFSAGMSGRTCRNKQSCDDFCCGLGYNVKWYMKKGPCNCRMLGEDGCCEVKCDTCFTKLEALVCK